MPNAMDEQNASSPNYSNARGRAAALSNSGKDEHVNPDTNAGHVQESSRSSLEGVNERKFVVSPNPAQPGEKNVIRPRGIKKV
jgi:hypothetical protein